MQRTIKCEKAISPVLSVLLMIIIIFVLGIVLFNFVIGMIENFTKTDSTQPFSLYIENAYINDEKHEILNTKGITSIPCNSTGILYVKGPYSPGGLYNIKLVFNSGQSLIYVARY